MEELKKKEAGPKPLPPVPMPKVVGVSDGEPAEPDVKEKRDKIREVSGPVDILVVSSFSAILTGLCFDGSMLDHAR